MKKCTGRKLSLPILIPYLHKITETCIKCLHDIQEKCFFIVTLFTNLFELFIVRCVVFII